MKATERPLESNPLMLLSRSYLKVLCFSLSSVLIDDKDNEHSTTNQNSNGTFCYGYTNRKLYNGAIQVRIGWFSNRTGTSFEDVKARGKD